MWDYVRRLLGEVTANEVALVALVFVVIVAYSAAPRIGAWAGEWLAHRR